MSEQCNPDQLRRYVAERGFQVEPMTNTTEAAEGAPLRIVAYRLVGPRRNQTVIPVNQDGTVSMFSVKLWCDGVDYATKKVAARRARAA